MNFTVCPFCPPGSVTIYGGVFQVILVQWAPCPRKDTHGSNPCNVITATRVALWRKTETPSDYNETD